MTDYAYGPGEWTALAHGGRAALLDPAIDAGAVAEIWESLSSDGALEAWLEVLAGHGLASLPSFGFVEPSDDGVRVVVRGDVVAHVGDYDISAGGMRTWREHVAPAGTGVVLRVSEGEAPYPLVGGVVLASTLRVGEVARATGEPETDESTESSGPEQGVEAVAVVAVDAPDEEQLAAAGPVPDEQELQPEPVSVPEAVVPDAEPQQPGTEPEDERAEDEQAEDEQPPEPEALDAQPSDEESAAGEDEVEPDFVLDDEDDDLEEDPEGAWAQQAEAVQLTDLPDGQHAAGELPPWAPPPGVIPSSSSQWGPPGAPEQDLGDHDGYTMRAADVPGPEAHEQVDQTLAPAHEDEHGQVADPDAPQVQLALSTGEQIELDRPVLIGRAPESSRFGFGQAPRLVTVPSPQQDISRTHVEIKLEGESVLVTDLRSTNGTVVVLPGSPPRRLHPGESVPVPVGTVIDLGDGVTAVVGALSTTAPIAY